MPKIDFATVDDVHDFKPLPEGKYPCRVDNVEEASTKNGDEMWKLRFEVTSGESKGRYIFDNLVFSPAAMKRVKLFCSRLGLDVSGELDLKPEMLSNKTVVLALGVKDYEDDQGSTKQRNVVPFDGYHRMEDLEKGEEAGKNELPF